jgi:pimeloyl-ACP methyl ester carboxylesterase
LALASLFAISLPPTAGASSDLTENSSADPADAVLGQIRARIEQLLSTPQPELFRRHLRSVLALCEGGVLKLRFAGPDRKEQEEEMLGYLKVIETGLEHQDAQEYLVEGRRALDIARLSHSDGTLQLYTVSLPAHRDAQKAYPLLVGLHGRWSDLPLALVADSLAPHDKSQEPNEDAIILIPWVRGNSEYRLQYGSEPDLWEAIDDLKTFAKLDPDRWYISGHSWGGDDTWSIVLRTPDLWAAAGIMAGNPIGVPQEEGLVTNARNVPFYLWRGDHDPTGGRVEAFNNFRNSLTAVGDPPKTVVAQGVQHMYRPQDFAAMKSWLFQHTRHRPDHFSYIIDTPIHRGVWGVSIPVKYPEAYFNVEPKVSFECWIRGNTVEINTKDTDRLNVDLGPQGLNLAGDVKIIVNGRQVFQGPVPAKPITLTW